MNSLLIGKKAPKIQAKAAQKNQVIDDFSLDQFIDQKYVILFFYPLDFTFVCPTELEDMAAHYSELQLLGVDVYSVSTDTHFSHKAWHDSSDAIGKIKFPMIGDPTGAISRGFGVMIEEDGLALRGTFLANPDGVIKVSEIHDLGIGRSAKDMVRKVKAAQYVENHDGEVCPAAWEQGQDTLTPSLDLVGKI